MTPFSPDLFQKAHNVSRETMEALHLFIETLIEWQGSINLVSGETIPHLWERHIEDSAFLYKQLRQDFNNEAINLVDMGSGAGLPGLIFAIMAFDAESSKEGTPSFVTLIESDQRKCMFLQEIVRRLNLKSRVTIIRKRIEDVTESDFSDIRYSSGKIIMTARALAPLAKLIFYGNHVKQSISSPNRVRKKKIKGCDSTKIPLYFLKGNMIEKELTDTKYVWHINYKVISNPLWPQSKLVTISGYDKI